MCETDFTFAASAGSSGEHTCVVVARLPPGRQCVETDEDERVLAAYLEAIEQAQAMNRESVRQQTAEEFDSGRIVNNIIATLANIRTLTISGAVVPVNSQ